MLNVRTIGGNRRHWGTRVAARGHRGRDFGGRRTDSQAKRQRREQHTLRSKYITGELAKKASRLLIARLIRIEALSRQKQVEATSDTSERLYPLLVRLIYGNQTRNVFICKCTPAVHSIAESRSAHVREYAILLAGSCPSPPRALARLLPPPCSSNGFHSFGTLICVHITLDPSSISSSMEVKVLKTQECKRKCLLASKPGRA